MMVMRPCPACKHPKTMHTAGCKALVLTATGRVKHECGCYITYAREG